LETAIRQAAGARSRPEVLHYNTLDGSKFCGAVNTYGFAKIFYAEKDPGGGLSVIVQPTIDHDPNPDRLAVRRNVGRQTIIISGKCKAANLPIGPVDRR